MLHVSAGGAGCRALAGALVLACALLARVARATCQLPLPLPAFARPTGATVGPGDTLVLASSSGTILRANLDDYTVQEDTALNDKFQDQFGSFDLEGIAMADVMSGRLYFVAQGKPTVFEYDWKDTRNIIRRFDLPGFEQSGTVGAESLTWVPTPASHHGGYFYIGSQLAGQVFIYELPIKDNLAPVVASDTKELISIWTPLKSSKNVAAMSYSGGYLFVNYDEGCSNHVLIYPILANGMPGELAEQYQVDVSNAEGMVVRKTGDDTWDILFTSDTQRAVFAYKFRFVSGFELHDHCGGMASRQFMRRAEASPSSAARTFPHLLALCALALWCLNFLW